MQLVLIRLLTILFLLSPSLCYGAITIVGTVQRAQANNGGTATITFDVAPTNAYAVHCTYWHSLLSDDELASAILWSMDTINRITNQSFYTGLESKDSQTDRFDGDGYKTEFRLSKGRIVALTSYSIDGITSGYVEDEDYYLYPESNRIAFESAPTLDRRNISVTYTYGIELNLSITELSVDLASIKGISLAIGRTGKTGLATGKGSKKSYRDSNRWVSQTKLLKERVEETFSFIGYKQIVDIVI